MATKSATFVLFKLEEKRGWNLYLEPNKKKKVVENHIIFVLHDIMLYLPLCPGTFLDLVVHAEMLGMCLGTKLHVYSIVSKFLYYRPVVFLPLLPHPLTQLMMALIDSGG